MNHASVILDLLDLTFLFICSYKENYSNPTLFPNISHGKDSWKKLDNSKIINYLPKLKYSIDFSIIKLDHIKNPISSDHEWIKYKLFQSDIASDGTTGIFCGGPISSMSWVPTPYDLTAEDQILAISVIPDPDKLYLSRYNYRDKGLIQFWNYGVLSNQCKPTDKPKLEFCIAHDHGIIWSMEWCPSGCYDVAGSKRMGLLAISSTDSSVYIYTVYRPGEISYVIF